MTHISGRNFGQLLGNPILNSGFTSSAWLAEISTWYSIIRVKTSILGHFVLNCACYCHFCYFSFYEIPCCSILFYDRACTGFTGGAYFPSS